MWREIAKNTNVQKEIGSAINEYMNRVVLKCCKNIYFIANPVTTRDPVPSAFIEDAIRILFKNIKLSYKINWFNLFKKLIKYYSKASVCFILFTLNFFVYRISKLNLTSKNKKLLDPDKELFVIDTFVMVEKNFPNDRFYDPYFGKMYDVLEKRNKQYVILSLLSGVKIYEFRKRWRTYNMLAEDSNIFITEYELLTISDYFRLLHFILLYPIVILQVLKLKIDDSFDVILKRELINSLDGNELLAFVSYLVGRRLNRLSERSLKVVSWYENSRHDKFLYRGIRDSTVDCYIYGCQFFIPFSFWLHIYPIKNEKIYNLVPDEILVSGKAYLSIADKNFKHKLGVSPRYDYLFRKDYNNKELIKRDNILILLTIHIEDSKNIINVVSASQIGKENNVLIKLHPNHLVDNPGFVIPDGWVITKEKLDHLCDRTKVVISSGSSGAILEAATMGCSVISIGNDRGITFNCLPDIGKGEIWDIAFDADELIRAYERLMAFRDRNIHRIVELSKNYRDMFFRKATEERLIDLLNL